MVLLLVAVHLTLVFHPHLVAAAVALAHTVQALAINSRVQAAQEPASQEVVVRLGLAVHLQQREVMAFRLASVVEGEDLAHLLGQVMARLVEMAASQAVVAVVVPRIAQQVALAEMVETATAVSLLGKECSYGLRNH